MENFLGSMLHAGKSIRVIAEVLGKTENAIRKR